MAEPRLLERFLDERRAAARIACDSTLVPAPGQYVMAHDPASDDPLAVPVFSAGDSPDGFFAASPLPRAWTPGAQLSLRGPLGRGFALPTHARRAALAALDAAPAYLLGLLPRALAQGAAVALVCDDPPEELPAEVEIRPLEALEEVAQWADYLALAVRRIAVGQGSHVGQQGSHAGQQGSHAGLPLQVGANLRVRPDPLRGPREAQALIVVPMPCGGLAKCGVCSVEVGKENALACEEGPTFDWRF